jgi:serpin B
MPSRRWFARALIVVGIGCGDGTPPPEPRKVEASSEAIQAAVASNAAVAVKLQSGLASQPGNLFYSPLGIEAVAGLLYAGAQGDTAAQLAALIDPPADPGLFHQGLGALLADLGGDYPGRGYTLSIANRLFAARDAQPTAAYASIASDDYHAPLQLEDFTHPDTVRTRINAWVSEQTAQHIPELFKAGDFSANDVLAIVDAIYFKAEWKTAFEKDHTTLLPFHLEDGSSVMVPTMIASRVPGRSFSVPGAQAVELPYRGGDLTFLALLPDSASGLPAFEASLSASDLTALAPAPGSGQQEVSVHLPRFSLRSRLDLKPLLAKLGVTDLFIEGKSDLSGISPNAGLYVGAFVHEAWVKVDEEGTEAAAATGAGITLQSLDVPIVFDRPFVFMIRDALTGAVLFTGRVTDPSASADP